MVSENRRGGLSAMVLSVPRRHALLTALAVAGVALVVGGLVARGGDTPVPLGRPSSEVPVTVPGSSVPVSAAEMSHLPVFTPTTDPGQEPIELPSQTDVTIPPGTVMVTS